MPAPAEIARLMRKLINLVANVDSSRISLRGNRQLPDAEDCSQGVNEFKSGHTRVANVVTVDDQRTSQPACFHFSPTDCVEARMLETSSCIRQRWAMIWPFLLTRSKEYTRVASVRAAMEETREAI